MSLDRFNRHKTWIKIQKCIYNDKIGSRHRCQFNGPLKKGFQEFSRFVNRAVVVGTAFLWSGGLCLKVERGALLKGAPPGHCGIAAVHAGLQHLC